MSILDRYIIRRFVVNFAILFVLIYLLATSIDLILQLDEFMQIVEERHGEDVPFLIGARELGALAVDLYWPRFFQLFAYLLGLVSVGAMAFTLSQMYRHRELVAILASGMSLYRVAWPIVVAGFGLNVLHMVNSNVVLPRLAPLLIRSHSDLGRSGSETFPLPFTEDGNGALIQSPAFHRDANTLETPTILERDGDGRTTRRITADQAIWNEADRAWTLVGGQVIRRSDPVTDADEPHDQERIVRTQSIDRFETDLTPRAIIVKRYAAFAQMLSPSQIEELLESPGSVDRASLARIKFGRYSVVLTNLLMLLLTLPFFLLREPANLLRQSVWCAAVALTTMLGSFIGMEVDLAGFSPVAAVFLPVAVLVPLTLGSLVLVKT